MMHDTTQYLAESAHYKLISEHETVYLVFKDGSRENVIVGDFYGNPDCAMISPDEQYCVMGGCGLILYDLKEPFLAYQYNVFSKYGYSNISSQFYDAFREKPDVKYISCIYQEWHDKELKYFRFVSEENEGTVLYRMNNDTKEVEKLGVIKNE